MNGPGISMFFLEEIDPGLFLVETRQDQTRKVVKGPPSNNKRALHQDLSIDKVHESAEVSRLEALCEARTKELNYAKIQLRKQAAGFEAMSVLVNYLANQLDAFSCPEIKAQLHKTQESLIKTQQQLDGLIIQRDALVDEIRTLKQDHQEQREHLEQERDEALDDLESLTVEKQQELEQASKQHDEAISGLKDEHSKKVSELLEQQDAALEEKQAEYDKRVEQVTEEHANTLADLTLQHETRLEEFTMRFENIKTTLVEKVEFLRNEGEDMRRREKIYMESCKRDTDIKVQAALAPCRHLTQEIDSLKTVMELRNQEIHQLRREKMDFEKEREELASAKDRIKRLEQEVENLKAIIDIKVEYERQIAEKHQSLIRRYDKESKANKRLSMDNEELVWRLSQSDFGSPDVFNRSLSHSPTNVETITPEGVKLRRHNPPHSPRSPRSPRAPVATDLDKSPTTSQTGLKRSGTYDLLNQEFDEEENIKQSDV